MSMVVKPYQLQEVAKPGCTVVPPEAANSERLEPGLLTFDQKKRPGGGGGGGIAGTHLGRRSVLRTAPVGNFTRSAKFSSTNCLSRDLSKNVSQMLG